MNKFKLTTCVFMSLFLTASCAPQENETTSQPTTISISESTYSPKDINTYKTVVTFTIVSPKPDGTYSYYISTIDGMRFDFLWNASEEPIPLTPGDYLEITHTGEIYCDAIFHPDCLIYEGELLSVKKVEHAIEQYQYRIIDGVGTFVSENSTCTYKREEFYLVIGKGALPFEKLKDGDYLTGYYSPVEDKYDENGKVIHNIVAFYKED